MNNTMIVKVYEPDNFELKIRTEDTLFTLARNVGFNKEKVNDIVSKMVVIKEDVHINVNELSKRLGFMRIQELNIFSIGINSNLDDVITSSCVDKGSIVRYFEFKPQQFRTYINTEGSEFSSFNVNSLYIIRNGNFLDIKNLIQVVNGNPTNIGRWRGSKSSHFKPFRFKTKFLSLGHV